MTPTVPVIASDFTPELTSVSGPVWAVPAIGKPVAAVKEAVIAGLRSRILGLERHASRRGPSSLPDDAGAQSRRGVWELGCPSFDELLPRGLETNSLHEIKGAPSALGGASAGDWMAAIGFAARLAVRRLDALSGMGISSVPSRTAQPWVLWCWPKALAGEFGLPSAAGFAHLGLDPSRLLIIETARASEALNALEESLKASKSGRCHRRAQRDRVDAGAPLEPCSRRNGNTLPSRHASIVRTHRRDGDPLACGARAKCGASLRSSCPGRSARLGHHRALPRQASKRCPTSPASGVV